MYLKLVRQPPNGETLHGHLYIDGKLYCDTLERTSVAVLPLVYPVQVTMSPKFKRLLPLLCNVPTPPSPLGKGDVKSGGVRTGIRIHRGSRPEHSQGCILVSPDVEQSITQLLLKAQHEHEEIRLEISDYLPDYKDDECPAHECAPRNRCLDNA